MEVVVGQREGPDFRRSLLGTLPDQNLPNVTRPDPA